MGIRSRHLVAAVAAAVVAGVLLAACAQPSSEQGSASGGTTSTVGPPSSTAPGRPSTSAPAPTSAPGRGGGAGQVVVRGTIRNGVEPGCMLLDGQDKHAYLLLDAQGGLREGARVEVVGQPVDQIASFCGEGSALSVVSVRPLR
jgi:hypothetical protein